MTKLGWTAAAASALAFMAMPAEVVRAANALTEFVGTYRYHGGRTVELIVDGATLTAVLDEMKYPLRETGVDAFSNSGGGSVRFERDQEGRVIAVWEGEVRFERLSSDVSAQTAGLADPMAGRVSGAYSAPLELEDGLNVGNVASASVPPQAVQAMIDGVLERRFQDVHSILVYRSGRLVVEEYFYGHDASRTHQLRSATKSFISASAGAAIADGALPGIQATLGETLDLRSLGAGAADKHDVTLGDLLTMRHGWDCDEDDETSAGHENRMYDKADWITFGLSIPRVRASGGEGRYCSAAALMVGRVVENAVGQTLPDYAAGRLFEPLGIRRADWSWNYALDSSNRDFAQLRMRPRDMLKFGVMYAQGGRWQGTQVLPADWVRSSLSPHARVEGQDYGYLWWGQYFEVPTPQGPRRVDTWVASGNGGQKIWIVPEFDLVAVFTAGAYNRGNSAPNAMMAQVLLPALVREGG